MQVMQHAEPGLVKRGQGVFANTLRNAELKFGWAGSSSIDIFSTAGNTNVEEHVLEEGMFHFSPVTIWTAHTKRMQNRMRGLLPMKNVLFPRKFKKIPLLLGASL